MKKNSFGQGLAVFLVVIGIFTLLVLLVKLVSLSALSRGCDNKQATNSSYCYLHKPYSGSSSSHSNSSYSNKSSSSSSSSSNNNKSTARSNASSYNSSTKKSSTGTSSSKKSNIYDSYDDGYDDISWMAIMIMIGMTGIVIMPMVWMTQWMNLTRIGKYGW